MNQYETDRLKEAEKRTLDYVELQRDEWLWDGEIIEAGKVDTLKQDETIRMDWRQVLQSERGRNVRVGLAMSLAGAMLMPMLIEGTASLSGFWIFLGIMVMFNGIRGRGMMNAGWGKWVFLMLAINLFTGSIFGFWWLFFFFPFWVLGGGTAAATLPIGTE